MIELPGQFALSAFRLAKYLRALRDTNARVSGLDARFTYYVACDAALSDDHRSKLDGLLLADDAAVEFSPASQIVHIVPRAGTISPWSSKATDIAHACGLNTVARIERGVAYAISGSVAFDESQLAGLAAVLFDRMTESVLPGTSDGSSLFEKHERAPLGMVPLLEDGPAALVRANAELGLALSNDEIDYANPSAALPMR